MNNFTNYTFANGTALLPRPLILPSLRPADIVRLVILSVLFVIGGPLNLSAASQLLSTKKNLSSSGYRMHLLKIHLNISDLLVLFVYTVLQICWLITFEFRGGPILCKIVKFCQTLSFSISSNIIVCIAFDRAASIFDSKRRNAGEDGGKPGLRRVKFTLLIAWIMAVLEAAPQFALWFSYQPFSPKSNWTQCVSVWFINELDAKKFNLTAGDGPHKIFISKKSYAIFHLVAVFFLPAFLVAVCYLVVMLWLLTQAAGGVKSADEKPSVGQWLVDLLTRRMTHASIDSVQMKAFTNQTTCEECPDQLLAPATNGSAKHGHKGSGGSSAPLLAPLKCHGLDAGDDVREGRTASNATALSQDMRKVKRRAIRISVLLVAAYIVTWVPYNALSVWGIVDEDHYMKHGTEYSFTQYLIVLNSVINPFLYGTVGFIKKYTTNA